MDSLSYVFFFYSLVFKICYLIYLVIHLWQEVGKVFNIIFFPKDFLVSPPLKKNSISSIDFK